MIVREHESNPHVNIVAESRQAQGDLSCWRGPSMSPIMAYCTSTAVLSSLERMTDDDLIRAYYDHFNARRLADAAALLADDAHLEHTGISLVRDGSDNYALFAQRWLAAFPDLRLTIERIDTVGDEWHEVYLVGEGTHEGDLDMGAVGVARASHRRGRMHLRHLLQVRQGRIASSTLSFDTNDLIRQIAR